MKTPSLLPLLLVAVVLPAGAVPDAKPSQRCDVDWLQKTRETMSKPGGAVQDADRIEVVGDEAKLKFGAPKTCDAATWRVLGTMEPAAGEAVLDPKTRQSVGGLVLKWRNPKSAELWGKSTVAPQIGIVLGVADFLGIVDADGGAVAAAADKVIDAGKALGLADFTASNKSLGELTKNSSGGPTGALKPRLVTVFEKEKRKPAEIDPKDLGATMRKLIVDGGGLGEAVIEFRLAVLKLQADLARPNDFAPSLPQGLVVAGADKAAALDDKRYVSALAALIGPGAAIKFDDQGLRAPALLDPVDQGLRNLVAIRSVEVAVIAAAAKERLGSKKISELETAARTGRTVKDLPEDSLAATTMKTLSSLPEYQSLDALYENNLAKNGATWAETPAAKEMFEARKAMQDAALSAKIETIDGRQAVVFTQNGKKTVLGSLVPSAVEKDVAARGDAADIISRFIVDGTVTDAKYKAVLAAVAGDGQPNKPLDTGLKGPEVEVSKDVPPSVKKIKDGAAGCENPREAAANDYETYAARKRAAAADMAGANIKSRNGVEVWKKDRIAASEKTCAEKKAAAGAIKQDHFDDSGIAKAARDRAASDAVAWCVADVRSIEEEAQKKAAALTAAEAGDRDPNKVSKAANDDLAAAFGVAIDASVEKLRKDYTTVGNTRLKKMAAATKNSPKLTAFTKLWFATNWPQPVNDATKKTRADAISACANKLGLADKSAHPKYHKPDDADNVDEYCEINKNLTKYIVEDAKGTNRSED